MAHHREEPAADTKAAAEAAAGGAEEKAKEDEKLKKAKEEADVPKNPDGKVNEEVDKKAKAIKAMEKETEKENFLELVPD